MVIFPKAKINIGLRITARRDDGYHDLQTIFYPVQLCDALEFVVQREQKGSDNLVNTGIPVNCDSDNNLIIKVLKNLRNKYNIPPLSIHLHKNIPPGAGLGGGSSDAACFIKALNRYFSLELSSEELKEISLTIGSDCPFFIDCIPSYAEGRGEKLSPVNDLPEGLYLVLVNPGINISTKEAYAGAVPQMSSSDLSVIYESDISGWRDKIVNDFEATIFKKYPEIALIKENLYNMGAVYSSMSGSGSTVYGIFRDLPVISPEFTKHVIYSGLL